MGFAPSCRWHLFLPAILSLAFGACATDPVREHLTQGRFAEAVELCQSQDRSGGACDEARQRAVGERLDHLARLRAQGLSASALASLAELDQILRLTERNPLPAGSDASRKVSDELAHARAALESDAKVLLDRPLACEDYWDKRRATLQRPPLKATMNAAEAAIRGAGRNACARLRATMSGDGPYWAVLVARYCAHFGEQDTTTRPTAARIEIAMETKDVAPAQEEIVRQSIRRAFRQSKWNGSPDPITVEAAVTGTYRYTQSDQTVVLHGSYLGHHLAYPAVPLGGPVMVVLQTVDFPYEVKDHWGRYEADLTLRLFLPGQDAPLRLDLRKAESLHGRDHNVTCEPAGIHPVHQGIPTADAWLSMELGAFAGGLQRALDGVWVQAYCQASTYTTNEAARCFLAGQSNETVREGLGKALGEDPQAIGRVRIE